MRIVLGFAALACVATFASAGFATSATNKKTGLCNVDQAERDPDSVLAPCTAIIDDQKRAKSARGFALYVRGKGYHNTKRFDLARIDYDAAITLTPEFDKVYPSRANIAFRGKRIDEGVQYLERALALNPKNWEALRGVGAVLRHFNQTAEAVDFFSQALRVKPSEPYSLIFRSEAYRALNQAELALADATQLVDIPIAEVTRQALLDEHGDRQDFHVSALAHRASIHEFMGRNDLAAQDFNRAVDYQPSALTFSQRGRFLSKLDGRQKDALADLDHAVALKSKLPRTYLDLGRLRLRLNEHEAALAAFDESLRLDPLQVDALFFRARTYRTLSETEPAVADMVRVAELCRNCSIVMDPLREAGYWRPQEVPTALTPSLKDAIRACMLDKRCN